MQNFEGISTYELDDINGGGLLTCAAGAIAGGLIGINVSLPYAVITGNTSAIGRATILGASVGAFVGGFTPLP